VFRVDAVAHTNFSCTCNHIGIRRRRQSAKFLVFNVVHGTRGTGYRQRRDGHAYCRIFLLRALSPASRVARVLATHEADTAAGRRRSTPVDDGPVWHQRLLNSHIVRCDGRLMRSSSFGARLSQRYDGRVVVFVSETVTHCSYSNSFTTTAQDLNEWRALLFVKWKFLPLKHNARALAEDCLSSLL